jgi:hypothetical protein
MDHGADFERHREYQTYVTIAPNSGANGRLRVSHSLNHAGSSRHLYPEYWKFRKQGKACTCQTNGLNASPARLRVSLDTPQGMWCLRIRDERRQLKKAEKTAREWQVIKPPPGSREAVEKAGARFEDEERVGKEDQVDGADEDAGGEQ